MSRAAEPRLARAEQALRDLDAAFSGTLGVAARDLRTDDALAFNADQTFPAASVIKLPLLLVLAGQASATRYGWRRRVRLDPANRTAGSGVVKDLDDGLRLTVRDWATLMTVVSDNTATNQCIDLVSGVEPVNAALRAWGCASTTLHRKVSAAGHPTIPYLGTATPSDLLRLVEALAAGRLLSPQATSAVLDILGRQQHTHLLARYLPLDSQADAAPRVYSKGGWISGVRNDVGLVRGAGLDYVVAIFTRDGADGSSGVDNEGNLVVARASRVIWDTFAGG